MTRPPYLPISPRETPPHPQMKQVLKGKRVADVEEVKHQGQKHQKASKSMSSQTALSRGKGVLPVYCIQHGAL